MGSRKPSAKRRQVEAFRSQLGGFDDTYARIEQDRQELSERREAALRAKSCESKNRYATQWDAREAVGLCASHGKPGLSYYRCEFCGGWHLTSHPR